MCVLSSLEYPTIRACPMPNVKKVKASSVSKTERFQAVQESAQYREAELVRTIRGRNKCFNSEFHALSDRQKTVSVSVCRWRDCI